MITRFAHTWIVWWMMATTAHLPFPVCDGDDLGANPESAHTISGFIDIDFVLLGCDLPDDLDDGPFDDDPDGASIVSGPFPAFLRTRTEIDPLDDELLDWLAQWLSAHGPFTHSADSHSDQPRPAWRDASLPIARHLAAFSVMRC